jgi:DinB superfamily
MKRSDIKIMPEYFEKYIKLVDDIELDDAFQNNINTLAALDTASLEFLGNKVYAPGKWTIKDIFQHVIDTERVMAYRTLRYARRDGVIPEGYDEDQFAANANAQHRVLENILEEVKQLHQSSRLMFRSFNDDTLQATGINWNKEMSVLAMGYLITGHFIHHLKIIEEKYLPLLHEMAE